ncbi:MAG: hypothetical protein QW098_05605 [Candidatus Hadarchaeales archaeon]
MAEEFEVMRCPRCGYEWKPKVPNPKECPRCKVRLDYQPSTLPQGAPQKIKEVREGMTRKLPWVAAAVVIVVAVGLGSWLWLQPAAVTTGWNATVSVSGPLSGPIAVGLLQGSYGDFGIENIFIMVHANKSQWNGKAPEEWGTTYGSDSDNYYAVISENGATVNIPYERRFDILVVYKIRGDNVAYMRFENTYEYINITGNFSKTENRLAGSDWESSCPWHTENVTYGAVGKDYPSSWMRIYNFIDNGGNGFFLPAGGSININLTIYTWK